MAFSIDLLGEFGNKKIVKSSCTIIEYKKSTAGDQRAASPGELRAGRDFSFAVILEALDTRDSRSVPTYCGLG